MLRIGQCPRKYALLTKISRTKPRPRSKAGPCSSSPMTAGCTKPFFSAEAHRPSSSPLVSADAVPLPAAAFRRRCGHAHEAAVGLVRPGDHRHSGRAYRPPPRCRQLSEVEARAKPGESAASPTSCGTLCQGHHQLRAARCCALIGGQMLCRAALFLHKCAEQTCG